MERSITSTGIEVDLLRRIDVQALRTLCVLVEESHVSKAAERMLVSQPSMSASLAQLRDIFNDPLLVRTGKGMMPTPNALEIAGRARQALELIEGSLSVARAFDPERSTMTFRINATESVGFMLIPRLTAVLEACAPNVQLEVSPSEPSRMREQLESGEADVVVAYQPHAPDALYTTTLYQQELRVVAAVTHPRVQGAITEAQYFEERHVRYQPSIGQSSIERQIDAVFADRGRRRRVGVSVPSALASAPVVAHSQHIATLTRALAEHAAAAGGLQVLEPPVPLGEVRVAMFWHGRTHTNTTHAWLRQLIRDLFH